MQYSNFKKRIGNFIKFLEAIKMSMMKVGCRPGADQCLLSFQLLLEKWRKLKKKRGIGELKVLHTKILYVMAYFQIAFSK